MGLNKVDENNAMRFALLYLAKTKMPQMGISNHMQLSSNAF
jgi:hypothetical protein